MFKDLSCPKIRLSTVAVLTILLLELGGSEVEIDQEAEELPLSSTRLDIF